VSKSDPDQFEDVPTVTLMRMHAEIADELERRYLEAKDKQRRLVEQHRKELQSSAEGGQ
jgi:hypothetical protein